MLASKLHRYCKKNKKLSSIDRIKMIMSKVPHIEEHLGIVDATSVTYSGRSLLQVETGDEVQLAYLSRVRRATLLCVESGKVNRSSY